MNVNFSVTKRPHHSFYLDCTNYEFERDRQSFDMLG